MLVLFNIKLFLFWIIPKQLHHASTKLNREPFGTRPTSIQVNCMETRLPNSLIKLVAIEIKPSITHTKINLSMGMERTIKETFKEDSTVPALFKRIISLLTKAELAPQLALNMETGNRNTKRIKLTISITPNPIRLMNWTITRANNLPIHLKPIVPFKESSPTEEDGMAVEFKAIVPSLNHQSILLLQLLRTPIIPDHKLYLARQMLTAKQHFQAL